MTSQDSARKFPESWRGRDNYTGSKELTNNCENFTEEFHRMSSIGEQIKPSLNSDILSITSEDNVARFVANQSSSGERNCLLSYKKWEIKCSVDDQRSDGKRNCLSPFNTHCHFSDNHSTSQTADLLNCCRGDELQKTSGSAAPSDLDKTGALVKDTLVNSNTGKLLDKINIELGKENYFQFLENCNPQSPKVLDTCSDEKQFENYTSPSNASSTDSLDTNTLAAHRISQFSKSKSLQFSGDFRKGITLKHQHSVKLSNTFETSPEKSVCNLSDNGPTEKLHLLKRCSTMSVSPCHETNARCPFVDVNAITAEGLSSSDNPYGTTVKSLRNLFGRSQEWQTPNLDAVNNSSSSQSATVSTTRVMKRTSSAIQRIQEQLLLQMENDETKCKNNKTFETIERELHPDTENKGLDFCEKGNVANTDRLLKQEKPYRQWHRMSRVLTAESKFIISPKLPIHSFLFSTKQNNKAPENLEELLKAEENTLVDVETVTPALKDPISSTSVTFSHSWGHIGCIPGNKEVENVSVGSDKQDDLSVSVVEETNCTTEPLQIDCDRSILPAMSVSATQKSQCCSNEYHSTEATEKNLNGQKMLHNKTFSKTVFSLSAVGTKTLSRQKLITRSEFLRKVYHNEHDKDYISDDDSSECDIIPNSRFITRTPLSSVSGASQVTGPSFCEHKKEFIIDLPAKKSKTAGPKLRTAIRSRTRVKSPVQMVDSTNASLGAESQTVLSKGSRNISRNGSSQSGDGFQGFSSNSRRDRIPKAKKRVCTESNVACGTGPPQQNNDGPESINRNWSSGNATGGEAQKESPVLTTKSRKVFLAGVASKLIQKVNRAGIRVPWNESTKKYQEVQATQDYKGSLPGQLSFRKGQKIKQRSFMDGPSDGMSYGYYRVGRLRKKKKGLFPSNCVTADIVDNMDASDILSLPTSTKSAM